MRVCMCVCDLCKALENHNNVQLIFFDISKAFDKVWNKGILHKLKCIGINVSFFQMQFTLGIV